MEFYIFLFMMFIWIVALIYFEASRRKTIKSLEKTSNLMRESLKKIIAINKLLDAAQKFDDISKGKKNKDG